MNQAPLRECEQELDADADLQWRQVHPIHVVDGVIARDGFRGTDAAADQVSTVQSALRDAEEAFEQHRSAGYKTDGTWAVTVEEVVAADCRVVADADCEDVPTVGHSFIDMRHLSKAEQRLARVNLAAQATSRGRLFPT